MLFVLLWGCGSKRVLPDEVRDGLIIQSTQESFVLSPKDIESVLEEDGDMGCQWLIQFTKEGGERFAEATTKLVGSTLEIRLFDTVVSSPKIMEPITQGKSLISWGESCADVQKKIPQSVAK